MGSPLIAKIFLAAKDSTPLILISWMLPLLLMAVVLGSCESEPNQGQRDAVGATAEEAAGGEQPQASDSHEPDTSAVWADAVQQAAATGICDRHEHVQREILWKLDSEDCADVTDADLASITGMLDLADHYTVTALDADDLRGLISLERLRLQLDLPALPAGIFEDLARLRDLTLYVDGQTPTLPDGTFDPLVRLQVLYSQAAVSGPDPFRNNKRLRKLWYPAIGGEGELNHLRNLRELNVGYVPHLTAGMLKGLTRLQTLYLDDAGLETIDAGAFDDLSALETLLIRENRLTSLPAGLFDNLSALEFLQIYANPLTELPPALFAHLTSLIRLQLDTGDMESLRPTIFDGLGALHTLTIYGEQLSALPPGLLRTLTELYRLDLRLPATTDLPPEFFLGVEKLNTVRISRPGGEVLTLTASLRAIDEASFVVDIAQATPMSFTVRFNVEGAELSRDWARIPAGHTTSEPIEVISTGAESSTVSVRSHSIVQTHQINGFTVPPAEEWEPLVFSFE